MSCTKSLCVTKEHEFYLGDTKESILIQCCDFRIDDNRQLYFKFKGCVEIKGHSYSKEFTGSEMYRDAVNFLWQKLPEFGYHRFKSFV